MEMEEEVSDHQQSAEVTPASSENDLLENKSEDSIDDDDDDDEDDDDIDKMLSELQTFQEVNSLFCFSYYVKFKRSLCWCSGRTG